MKRKVKITKLPKKVHGGETRMFGPQTPPVDNTSNPGPGSYIGGNDPKIKTRRTLKPTTEENANLEAELGETVVTNLDQGGIPEFYKIGGKRHSRGGTFLNLPENSFIYSRDNKMKIKDPDILEMFGKTGKKGYTPAELSKTYDLNKYREILANNTSSPRAIETAEAMIQNYNLKLGALALVQESMKGFENGIPDIAQPYLQSVGIDPSQLVSPQNPPTQQQVEMAMFGKEVSPKKRRVAVYKKGGQTLLSRDVELQMFNKGGNIPKDDLAYIDQIIDFELSHGAADGTGLSYEEFTKNGATDRASARRFIYDNYVVPNQDLPIELRKRAVDMHLNSEDPRGALLEAAGKLDATTKGALYRNKDEVTKLIAEEKGIPVEQVTPEIYDANRRKHLGFDEGRLNAAWDNNKADVVKLYKDKGFVNSFDKAKDRSYRNTNGGVAYDTQYKYRVDMWNKDAANYKDPSLYKNADYNGGAPVIGTSNTYDTKLVVPENNAPAEVVEAPVVTPEATIEQPVQGQPNTEINVPNFVPDLSGAGNPNSIPANNIVDRQSPKEGETRSEFMGRTIGNPGTFADNSVWNGTEFVKPNAQVEEVNVPKTTGRTTKKQNIPDGSQIHNPEAANYNPDNVRAGHYIRKDDGTYEKVTKVVKESPYSGRSIEEIDEKLGESREAYGRLEQKLLNDKDLQNAIVTKYKERIANAKPNKVLTQADIDAAAAMSPEEIIKNYLDAEKQMMIINATAPEGQSKGHSKYDKIGADGKLAYTDKATSLGLNPLNPAQALGFQAVTNSMLDLGEDEKTKGLVKGIKIEGLGYKGDVGRKGRSEISLDDGIIGDQTIGQIATYSDNKKSFETEALPDAVDKTKEVKTQDTPFKTPTQQPKKWWTQDLLSTGNLAGIYAGIKKSPVYTAPLATPPEIDPTFVDFRGTASNIASNVASGQRQAATFAGPQAYNARASQISAKADDQIRKAQALEYQTNQGAAMKADQINTMTAARLAPYMQATNQRRFDAPIIAEQQYKNAKNKARTSLVGQINQGLTNAGNTAALNAMTPNFQVDPGGLNINRTGDIYKTGVANIDKNAAAQMTYEKAFNQAKSLKPGASGTELDKIARGLMGQVEVPNVADATQLMYPGAART